MRAGKRPITPRRVALYKYAYYLLYFHMRRFFLIFFSLQLLLFGIELLQPVQQHLVLPWTALLAKICVLLVTQFDVNAAALGKLLWNPATGFGVSIEPGCNGVEACIILFAALIAFPASGRHRAKGLALGFIAVQGLNIVRIISLFYLGQWNDTAFRIAHEYLWQGLIMLDVLVVWLWWVKTSPEAERAPQEPEINPTLQPGSPT